MNLTHGRHLPPSPLLNEAPPSPSLMNHLSLLMQGMHDTYAPKTQRMKLLKLVKRQQDPVRQNSDPREGKQGRYVGMYSYMQSHPSSSRTDHHHHHDHHHNHYHEQQHHQQPQPPKSLLKTHPPQSLSFQPLRKSIYPASNNTNPKTNPDPHQNKTLPPLPYNSLTVTSPHTVH